MIENLNGSKHAGSNSVGSMYTVVLKRESRWHNLWRKWLISDPVFYNMKMPPCSCPLGSSLILTGATIPLTGALKWGTVQNSTST